MSEKSPTISQEVWNNTVNTAARNSIEMAANERGLEVHEALMIDEAKDLVTNDAIILLEEELARLEQAIKEITEEPQRLWNMVEW